ncbi:MAG TPA: sugar-binding domain-containing protein [Pseudonocardia sp.]|jgi:DNA-binding transcriptional regulator LsrR (DeoR family)|nr:sugar-binding domain-containing protein [Pseudonocardia sp.]
MPVGRVPQEQSGVEVGVSRFPPELLYRAARLYYLENATQAEVARTLGTSRPTVSRLLAEARAVGIVHIEIREPQLLDTRELAERVADALGLARVWVASGDAETSIGEVLAPSVAEALRAADLRTGDTLLVSSGNTVNAVSYQRMPPLPGVVLAPTVGGRDEPAERYQTNEITRRLAVQAGGTPVLLYAPAMPGPALYEQLVQDESIRRVTELWTTARAALLGIGAPTASRTVLPSMLPRELDQLKDAVADICVRPFDTNGTPIPIPGVERLVAMKLDDLRRIPHSIGLAVGAEKVDGIVTSARSRYINELVTDLPTAQLLLDAVATTRSA